LAGEIGRPAPTVNNLPYSVHGRSTAVVWRRDSRDL